MLKEIAKLLEAIRSALTPEMTYSASVTGLIPAASATDIFEIVGGERKTVYVHRVQISGIATGAGAFDFVLLRRDGASSGGTSTAPTTVRHSLNADPASASLKAYTANPTVGRLYGNLQVIKGTVTTSAGVIPGISYEFDLTKHGLLQPVELKGRNATLALNLNATTITGGSLDIDITWTEK